ncbi:MAG: GIY-YIG nuclease family protein [Bacteroidales bacterium]|jgi:group I intron endonuclease|nr:GIY-YIG nuclease family protein [Bacteroidales bacterium]
MAVISGIYCLVFPNGRLYVGKSKKFVKRWKRHEWNAKRGYQDYIYRAIREYGWDNIKKVIIERLPPDEEILNIREKFWIKELNSRWEENGYNLTDGGDGAPNLSKESIEKMSAARKGKPAWNKGKTGGHLTEAHKKKISETGKGHPGYNKGGTLSLETCRKMSEFRKGKNHSEEWKQNLSKSLKGRVFSEKTRKKMSEAKKGFHHSEETRKKMSMNRKGRKINRKKAILDISSGDDWFQWSIAK